MNLRLLLSFLLAAPLAAQAAGDRPAAPFEFVAFGCMPYYFPEDDIRFRNLIEAVNARRPAFSFHLGDTKAGSTPCDDASLEQVRAYFDQFDQPLIYSVGDNEWTDCHREVAGGYDPLERLARVRELFFPEERSLGRSPMPLTTQRRDPVHGEHVENSRWVHGGVMFISLHVVGSNNNNRPSDPAALAEYQRRDAANAAWLREGFAAAASAGASGVVIAIQANPFADGRRGAARSSGFENFVEILQAETLQLGRPVLLVHADSHYFRIDKPMRAPDTGAAVEHFTRAETFGARDMHAISIRVDPSNPELFEVRPLLVEKNLVHPW